MRLVPSLLVIELQLLVIMFFHGLSRIRLVSGAFCAQSSSPWQSLFCSGTSGSGPWIRFVRPSPHQQLQQVCGFAGFARGKKNTSPHRRSRQLPQLFSSPSSSPSTARVFKANDSSSGNGKSKKQDKASGSLSSSSSSDSQGPKLIYNRPQLLRADRVLANRGWGSRSECFQALVQRRVKVMRNPGEYHVLSGPSDRLDMNDIIFVDSKEVPQIPLLLVYHKPKWVLSVMKDPHKKRPCLETVLPQPFKDLHPVGRLDYDTSGLILFSSLGPLTQKLLHPNHQIPKEYVAIVRGHVVALDLARQLELGVETTEGIHKGTLIMDSVANLTLDESKQIWKDIRDSLPPEYDEDDLEERRFLPDSNAKDDESSLLLSQLRLVVTEGKHRMVRRMLANCGHGVVELKREKQGAIELGDLPVNQFRRLTPEEHAWAQSLVPSNARNNKNRSVQKNKKKK